MSTGFPVVQTVKNLSTMRETWVPSLGWEDPLEKGKATHSSIMAWENSMDCVVHGVAKSVSLSRVLSIDEILLTLGMRYSLNLTS